MLLAIDAGNTNMVFAVFEGRKLVKQWRLSTDPRRTADEYALAVMQLMHLEGMEQKTITDAIISTVVPGVLFALRRLCRQYFHCEPLVIGEQGVDIGIAVRIERASEIGADRLVNSVEAFRRFGGNTIVIDFGTATTFDVINQEGEYIGGVIAPGINLSMDALHVAAAKLPKIAIECPAKVVGTSTVSAMQSGIYWGYMGLIEGITNKIKEERQTTMQVVATGGLASLFFKGTTIINFLEPELMMYGLQYIFERNSNTTGNNTLN